MVQKEEENSFIKFISSYGKAILAAVSLLLIVAFVVGWLIWYFHVTTVELPFGYRLTKSGQWTAIVDARGEMVQQDISTLWGNYPYINGWYFVAEGKTEPFILDLENGALWHRGDRAFRDIARLKGFEAAMEDHQTDYYELSGLYDYMSKLYKERRELFQERMRPENNIALPAGK